MRYVSEDRLKQIAAMPASVFEAPASVIINYLISRECQELQEPWMTLDEFFISGFDGECWICLDKEEVYRATYLGKENGFRNIHGHFSRWGSKHITHVMPVHKPEPPK